MFWSRDSKSGNEEAFKIEIHTLQSLWNYSKFGQVKALEIVSLGQPDYQQCERKEAYQKEEMAGRAMIHSGS